MIDLDINPMKYVLYTILTGNVICLGNNIEVLTKYPPRQSLDCITMDDRGGSPTPSETIKTGFHLATPDDDFYDPENPDKMFATTEERLTEQSGTMNVHIWGNSDKTRSCIIRNITRIIDEAKHHCYKYCANNEGGTCKTTTRQCDAIIIKNSLSVKGICPYADIKDVNDPNYRNPLTKFELVDIIPSMVNYGIAGDADDISIKREVYHSILPIDYTLETVKESKVIPLTKINLSNKTIME